MHILDGETNTWEIYGLAFIQTSRKWNVLKRNSCEMYKLHIQITVATL